MPEKPKSPPPTARRKWVSLSTALTFVVVSVSGILVFFLPFSITLVGLHSLMGFAFLALIGLHVWNNRRHLTSYARGRLLWLTLAITASLTALFLWQPAPVKAVLALSRNTGPPKEHFEMNESGMVFDYQPSPQYRMRLTVKPGPAYHTTPPPHVAIWLENQGGYHIKTLLAPADANETPYWKFKHAGWENAKREAEARSEVDAVSSATPNGSFDPADYILARSNGESTPYQLLLEINQPGDEQPSLVHTVEIDNRLPRHFQLLELTGYPKRETTEDGKEAWPLHFVDGSFTTALDLIDSALLTIDRDVP